MKQAYLNKRFNAETLVLIDTMNRVIDEYVKQGFVLTVRQLYYQLVARAVIANTPQEYKRAAETVNNAKLAGLLDWDAIEDRTREFVRRTRWHDGPQILRACIDSFHVDHWRDQEHRVFVIVEKEALVGVLQGVCAGLDIPLLAARGYPSGSVLREFAQQDLIPAMARGQVAVILHLGDHDPSGIDMTRDLRERLELFCEDTGELELHRIALNMPQIEDQKPPENPAKTTDSRFGDYRRKFGESSWELDALSPTYLARLIRTAVKPYIDAEKWSERQEFVKDTQQRIEKLASGWR